MRPRLPITRIGWRDALNEIRAGRLSLLKYEGGHAELLGPDASIGEKNHVYARHYMTAYSVQLLEKAQQEGSDDE